MRDILQDLAPGYGRQRLQGFLPQLDEFHFTTAEKKIWKIADALFRIS